jgi:hypothetical protein
MSDFDFSRLTFGSDWPELETVNAEMRRLTRQRQQIISDRLRGRTRQAIGGMEFVTDPTCPPNTIELRDRDGRILSRIVNVSADRTQEEG